MILLGFVGFPQLMGLVFVFLLFMGGLVVVLVFVVMFVLVLLFGG